MRPRARRGRRERSLRVVGLLLGAGIAICVVAPIWLPAIGRWLARPSHIGKVDAIVVLGGNYPARDQRGIDLYRQGLAAEFWRTGAAPLLDGADARAGEQLARQQGVPAQAIHLLATASSWEDGQAIAALARQRNIHSVLIVTDWSHSRRALNVIGRHLADSRVAMYYDSPAVPWFTPENWWLNATGRQLVLGEIVKHGYYWLRYGVAPWAAGYGHLASPEHRAPMVLRRPG